MKIRAKMRVDEVKSTHWGAEIVKLSAVHASGKPEDNSFAKATPCATLEMQIDNPEAQGILKAGNCFYVDFTRVNEEAAPANPQ